MKARRGLSNAFQVLKDYDLNLNSYIQQLSAIIEGERKILHGINCLKQIATKKTNLKKIQEAVLQTKERKAHRGRSIKPKLLKYKISSRIQVIKINNTMTTISTYITITTININDLDSLVKSHELA